MNQVITAMFVDGILKPDQELALTAGTRVRLRVESTEEASGATEQASLDLDRLCDAVPIVSDGPHLTRDQLHERP